MFGIIDKLQHEMYWNICCDACHGMGGWINYNMRCIETFYSHNSRRVYPDKLQHEMYWNIWTYHISEKLLADKLQHEMYWNPVTARSTEPAYMINYNMRCIETRNICMPHINPKTDKLQHEMYWNQMCAGADADRCRDKLQHEMYWNKETSGKLKGYTSTTKNK